MTSGHRTDRCKDRRRADRRARREDRALRKAHRRRRPASRRSARRYTVVAATALASLGLGASVATGLVLERDTTAAVGSPARELTAAARMQVETYVAGRDGHVAVALFDRVTGAELVVNGDRPFRTASILTSSPRLKPGDSRG